VSKIITGMVAREVRNAIAHLPSEQEVRLLIPVVVGISFPDNRLIIENRIVDIQAVDDKRVCPAYSFIIKTEVYP
jgi:hypothetical protein